MKRILTALAVLLFCGVACTGPLYPTGTVVHADPAFSEPERAQLALSADDWFVFSGGVVRYTMAFDRAEGPRIVRLESSMRAVKDHDAEIANRGIGVSFGWFDRSASTIYLVVDRYPLDGLRYMAAHELGHMSGLRWPNCSDKERDCKHSPDPNALMAARFANRPFGESDLLFCRSSGICR